MAGLATIIMPFYNQAAYTLDCLHSLARCTEYDDVQLILVDNDSEPEQTSTITDYLHAGYPLDWQYRIQPENRGWVGGCIAGYEAMHLDTRWVVLLNNDTILGSAWLSRLVASLESHPDYGVMGCVSVGGGGWQDLGRLQARGWIHHDVTMPSSPEHLEATATQLRVMHGGQVREARMVAFFCAAFPHAVLDEVAFLDPAFGLGLGDDDDLCRRIGHSGRKVGLALDVAVWHWRRTTFNALALEGIDWQLTQQINMAYLEAKEVAMGCELRYLGDRDTGYPYIMGVPARDLDPRDIMALAEQGWDQKALVRSGLYVPVDLVEVQPFCGYPTQAGNLCRRPVEAWGQRCWQHPHIGDNDND